MKDDKKRFSKLVWLLILPLELTPKTAREKRWADFPDNFFGLILRKSDYLSCFGLWMRFFQQSQAKVHGQKPLPCTKTNKTYLAKHPSTYFFIGSQMVGFHGTSTYRKSFGRKFALILFWRRDKKWMTRPKSKVIINQRMVIHMTWMLHQTWHLWKANSHNEVP